MTVLRWLLSVVVIWNWTDLVLNGMSHERMILNGTAWAAGLLVWTWSTAGKDGRE